MRHTLLALIALMLAPPLFAQDESSVSLTIRFAGGTNQFHVGEIIPVEMLFKATFPDLYDMSTRNYDRGGRLDIETFHVTPSGRDPLERYYSTGVFIGGGLGSTCELSSEPQIMREDLNEWIALDKAGHYSLYVISGRVSRRASEKAEPVELRSNSLEFDIVLAEPAWQQQALSTAVATLNMGSSTEAEKMMLCECCDFWTRLHLCTNLCFVLAQKGIAAAGMRSQV